jgi:hypothetical protein
MDNFKFYYFAVEILVFDAPLKKSLVYYSYI